MPKRIERKSMANRKGQKNKGGIRHGYEGPRAKKSLGQNFLVDEQIIEEILDGALIDSDDLVIEIGPGRGALTAGAAKRCRRLVAVELDEDMVPFLDRVLAGHDNATVLHDDFLKVDLAALIAGEKEKDKNLAGVKIIGNIPYYITTPILMKVLGDKSLPTVDSLTVMMQKEVADRLAASPGEKAYGELTVVVQYYCDVYPVADVPRTCFRPVPNVDSRVLRLAFRKEQRIKPADDQVFFTCVKAAFSKRRKTLLNCFTGLFGMDKEQIKEEFAACGMDGTRRGETLTIEEFALLGDHFAKLPRGGGGETPES